MCKFMVYLLSIYYDDTLFCIDGCTNMIKIKIKNKNDRIREFRCFAFVSHRSHRENPDISYLF